MPDLHDLVAAYAVDALDGDERTQFQAHLEGCATCQAELTMLQPAVEELAGAVATPPPDRLRMSVLDAVAGTPQESTSVDPDPAPTGFRLPLPRWITGLAAAAAVLIVLAFAGVIGGAPSLDDVVRANDSQTITLRGDVGTARFIYSEELDTGYFVSALLPPVEADQTYQLWLIDDAGPASAGTFVPNRDFAVKFRVEGGVESGKTLGLTIEPAGGSPAPTGEVLLAEVLERTMGLEL